MMKFAYFAVLLLAWASCSKEQRISVVVKNTTGMERHLETVEIDWKELEARMPEINPNRVIVLDDAGQEIASQVIFQGTDKPVSFIFQVSVQPNAETIYQVKSGLPVAYEKQVYGRFVPERKDDYAWENNLVGHRMYGPALEATGEISNGIDTWVKCTGELLIDEWYRTGDYHKDHGKGMDCYKVGRTLGAGAMAPFVDGKIVLANNYVGQQTLDNGPLRVSFRLDYAPFRAGERELTETRIISLDANSHFNRIEEIYAGASEGMPVVAGIVARREPGDTLLNASKGIVAYWEPRNNDNGDNNGHTGIGVVFPDSMSDAFCRNGHFLALGTYPGRGKSFVYYMGTGWSKADVPSASDWFRRVEEESFKLKHPLQVQVLDK